MKYYPNNLSPYHYLGYKIFLFLFSEIKRNLKTITLSIDVANCWYYVQCSIKSLFYFRFLSQFSFLIRLLKQLTLFCVDPQDPALIRACANMPSLEFVNPSDITQFKKIKELLQDSDHSAWILCEGQWIKILATKNFSNISQLGLAFEANIDALDSNLFEIFHICRVSPCRFVGTTLDEGAVFRHVTALSFRPINPDPSALSVPNVKNNQTNGALQDINSSPRSISFGTKLFYAAFMVTFIGVFLRLCILYKELDIGTLIEQNVEAGITTFLQGALNVLIRFESALTRGIAATCWKNYHWSLP